MSPPFCIGAGGVFGLSGSSLPLETPPETGTSSNLFGTAERLPPVCEEGFVACPVCIMDIL